MEKLQSSMVTKSVLIAVCSLALSASSSFGISFTISEGKQPGDVGTITLTQVDANTVKVLLDLSDTSVPAPRYGLINTGGPHTPFTFTLAGTEAGVTATFLQPVGGIFGLEHLSFNLGGGNNTPFGAFGIAIDSSAGNGSGGAYYGDLEFNLTRTSGLLMTDFIANADGVYFAADLTDGSNTGAQGWKTPGSSVPDSGTTLALMGMAVGSLGLIRRKMK